MKKAEGREGLSKQTVTQLGESQSSRLLMTSYAGSGNSWTVRAIVRSLRPVVRKHGADPHEVWRNDRTPIVGVPRFLARGSSFEIIADDVYRKEEAEGHVDAHSG